MKRKPELILALDVETIEEARRFVDQLRGQIKLFKIGSQLFTACGPDAVQMVHEEGGKVFLDLKWFDIPNTVYSAVISGTGLSCTPALVSPASSGIEEQARKRVHPAVFMMTVHIRGGIKMLQEAIRGAQQRADEFGIEKPFIVGVTHLTSEEREGDTEKDVLSAAKIAKDAGLDGVVCSVLEAKMLRDEFGDTFLIVTPGIRPVGVKTDDQKRTASAEEAVRAGSDFLVVGRPVLESAHPRETVEEMLQGIRRG